MEGVQFGVVSQGELFDVVARSQVGRRFDHQAPPVGQLEEQNLGVTADGGDPVAAAGELVMEGLEDVLGERFEKVRANKVHGLDLAFVQERGQLVGVALIESQRCHVEHADRERRDQAQHGGDQVPGVVVAAHDAVIRFAVRGDRLQMVGGVGDLEHVHVGALLVAAH